MLFEKDDTYSLRGVCMILIIIHHLFQKYTLVYDYSVNPIIYIILKNIGYLSTSVFFLLSGYGLFLSLNKHEPLSAKYVVTHIFRLLLPFIFIWLIDLLYCLFIADGQSINIVGSLLTLTFPGGGSSLWFIKEIYLLYILTFIVFGIIKTNTLRISTIVGFVLAFVVLSIGFWNLTSMWHNSILCFPLGMFFANNIQRIKDVRTKVYIPVLFIVFLIAFFLHRVCQSHYFPEELHFISEIFMILSAIVFSIWAIIMVSVFNISNQLNHFIGKNSLIFYLTHILLVIRLSGIFDFWTFSLLVIIGTFVLSIIYINTFKRII